MKALHYILQYKIIAIIRGVKPKDVLPIVASLHEGGIKIVEITLNSEDALELISKLSSVMKNKMLIGAGTVLDVKSAKAAAKHGAQFIISPSLDINVVKFANQKKLVSIPGAFTATEIVEAHKAGADIVKVFPAPSPRYIKDLQGPLSHIRMMPTGGINLENIDQFKKAGAVAFGVGSSLINTEAQIIKESLRQLSQKANQFVEMIK